MTGENQANETKKAKATRPGFNEKGEPYAGVDKDSGARVAVVLSGLQDEFGKKRGAEIYRQIAGVRGGSVFFNPNIEATDYTPNLNLSGVSDEVRAEIDAILSAKEQ